MGKEKLMLWHQPPQTEIHLKLHKAGKDQRPSSKSANIKPAGPSSAHHPTSNILFDLEQVASPTPVEVHKASILNT
ncbi:hypothetical protein Y1Q_0006478 [Alligator mississippiensis]|uniref:Uncharacterized protein n=1 Tax=Alligator mississippiensis TaxID=8496 RepID=A0A151MVP1_ALLMI|nr:hypothetical protein Y1Q_0006478 [Alligator mississippiensis]